MRMGRCRTNGVPGYLRLLSVQTVGKCQIKSLRCTKNPHVTDMHTQASSAHTAAKELWSEGAPIQAESPRIVSGLRGLLRLGAEHKTTSPRTQKHEPKIPQALNS